jgi:NO-binding membrane sensor protein with MHYT domain
MKSVSLFLQKAVFAVIVAFSNEPYIRILMDMKATKFTKRALQKALIGGDFYEGNRIWCA